MTTMPTERLMRKRRKPRLPVTSRSMALFRLGEACNNRCPMCSNSGRPEAFFIQRQELLARVERLARWGFNRVILTGGEPTIHPAFEDVMRELQRHDIAFDINTHGRSFARASFAETCVNLGLERAIVSLHSHEVEASRVMSGFSERAHQETVEGILALLDAGVMVTVNLVLSSHNVEQLTAFVEYCGATFGVETAVKLCFPFTGGKGGSWDGIQLRYGQIQAPLRAAMSRARELGVTVLTESVPNCVLGDQEAKDTSRSGFGETHYLEDVDGQELYPIRYIESQLKVFPSRCSSCSAVSHCPGVQEAYVLNYGAEELRPFEPERANAP